MNKTPENPLNELDAVGQNFLPNLLNSSYQEKFPDEVGNTWLVEAKGEDALINYIRQKPPIFKTRSISYEEREQARKKAEEVQTLTVPGNTIDTQLKNHLQQLVVGIKPLTEAELMQVRAALEEDPSALTPWLHNLLLHPGLITAANTEKLADLLQQTPQVDEELGLRVSIRLVDFGEAHFFHTRLLFYSSLASAVKPSACYSASVGGDNECDAGYTNVDGSVSAKLYHRDTCTGSAAASLTSGTLVHIPNTGGTTWSIKATRTSTGQATFTLQGDWSGTKVL